MATQKSYGALETPALSVNGDPYDGHISGNYELRGDITNGSFVDIDHLGIT